MTLTNGAALAELRLPVPNSTKSFWHEELHELADHQSTPILPQECDVLIVGSGYAGVSAAYTLVKGPGSENIDSVVILEAREACSGATGRNGGHLRPDLYGDIPIYIERYGVEAGAEYAEYEVSHVQAIKKLIATEGIECDFRLTRLTDTWANEDAAKRAKANYDLMVSRGLRFMDDVDFVYGHRAAGVSGVKDAKACATYSTGSLWPYKFIMTLLKRALSSGKVNLQTHTAATGIHEDAGGFIVETSRGKIRAKKVIHASNAYVSSLLPEYAKSIVPCKGFCCHISVPEGSKAPHLSNSHIVRDKDKILSYLIPRWDGGIVVGGASYLFRPFKDQWYNNTDDSTLIEVAKDYYHGFMQRTFRGWEESKAYVSKMWTGVMGYSFDSLPHLGEVPGNPGQYIVAGFNGHGMPVIWFAAKGIAEMVASGKSYEDTTLPWIAKTTAERIEQAHKGPEGGDILA